jgi:hypothetical protein
MFKFAGAAGRLAFIAFAVLSLAKPAAAQYLTFVSAAGNDANNCLVQTAPCKTLQKAINATAASGQVRLLSNLLSTGFINKSITIDGAGNTLIGAITINGASAVVTLRGLGLNGVGGYVNGISIISAAAVHIQDCTVERYTSDGIKLITTAATKLFISNTVSRANSGNGDGLHVEADNAQAVIENSRFENNAFSGIYLRISKANIGRSVASGNGRQGIVLVSGFTKITETAADDNAENGFVVRASPGTVLLEFAEASGNGIAGLQVDASTHVAAVISNCVFAGPLNPNNPGVNNQGTLVSRGNNTVFNSVGNAPIGLSVY